MRYRREEETDVVFVFVFNVTRTLVTRARNGRSCWNDLLAVSWNNETDD